MQPCQVYTNEKSPRQHIFAAAAALYALTGSKAFRAEADFYFDPDGHSFLTTRDNVYTLGAAILARERDPEGTEAQHSSSGYQQFVERSVQQWALCSGSGRAGAHCECAPDRDFCLRSCVETAQVHARTMLTTACADGMCCPSGRYLALPCRRTNLSKRLHAC